MSPYFAPALKKARRMASTLTIGMPQIAASTARLCVVRSARSAEVRAFWVRARVCAVFVAIINLPMTYSGPGARAATRHDRERPPQRATFLVSEQPRRALVLL